MSSHYLSRIIRIYIILMVSWIFMCSELHAEGFYLRGAVRDAFTNAGIEDCHVVVLTPDSSIVASDFTKIPTIMMSHGNGTFTQEKEKTKGATFQIDIPQEGEYIISVSMLGYEPEFRKMELKPSKRNKPVEIGDIYLIPKSKELDELTVTATKLKVYHKGDTLVYDASAFVMDKHNVLEDLVKNLPGVEFRDGQVFVNGRFVDNIVIGGKDFMKNDPKQLMAMLPAYVVDKLKFYDKSGEQSKTMGKDMHDSSYVMDITMKRDYHGSWLGYLRAGLGTERRWSGIGFVSRFDDRQSLSLSLDANNLSMDRTVMEAGIAGRDGTDMNDTRYMKGNIDYSYYPTDKLRIDASAKAVKTDRKEGTDEIFTSSQALAEQIMRQTSRDSDLSGYSFSGEAGVTLRPRKGLFGRLSYAIDHGKENTDDSLKSLTGSGDEEIPDSLMEDLLLPELPTDLNLKNITNVYSDNSSSDFRTWGHNVATEAHVATGDNLLRITGTFKAEDGHRLRNRDFLSRIFSEGIGEDRSLSLFDTRTVRYKVNAGLDYDINYADNSTLRGILTPFYHFEWDNHKDDREMYDLPLDGGVSEGVLDMANSRWIGSHTWSHSAGANLKHEFQLGKSEKWMMLSARMAANLERKDVGCTYNGATEKSGHDFLLFTPELSLRFNPKSGDRRGSKSSIELKLSMSQKSPSSEYLAPYTDTSDPMNIYTGNPDLGKQTDLAASLQFRHQFEKYRSSFNVALKYLNTWDAVAMKSFYDMATGIRTIMPVNAGKGNEASLDCGYNMPLSGQAWWLSVAGRGSITRSPSLTVFTGNQGMDEYMDFSSYRTMVTISHNPSSRKIMGSYSAMYQGNAIFGTSAPGSHMRSLTQTLQLNLNLPASISVSANCRAITRFGYIMPSLNRTIFLLNANIQKSLFNDKVNLELSAVDILRQRKNAFSTVDAAGVTESINTRFIPSYFLFSVYYRWSHTPKKKNL